MHKKWRFSVDRGGTFTDIVGMDPSGELHTMKLLSDSTEYEDPSIEGIGRILGLRSGGPLPEDRIESIRFGTTVATNALLEGKGGNVALFITGGFRDLLEIGYQDRPDIFRLCINKPALLYSTVIEVKERIDFQGKVLESIDAGSVEKGFESLKDSGIDAVAIVFMHAWINPANELECGRLLHKKGFSNIYLSHVAINQIKIISRGQSTLVDAYLSVVLTRYLQGIRKYTGRIPVEFMQSDGTLSGPETFYGKKSLVSGPAGGVVAVASVAGELAVSGAIGFDMGGTSTDVSRYDGEFQKKYEHKIAGIPLQVEMMDIVTVAAGGGSILEFDGQKMTAGPGSAGSYPGPACYGFGGPLTVTDANLLTGRLVREYFPRTFGPDRNSLPDLEVVRRKFLELADAINQTMGTSLSVYDAAAGFLRVADEKMAAAIREISVSRGFDVREYGLVCFGGAGGQHACSIARLLDIKKVIIHPLSGVMSAYGIGLSKRAWTSSRTILNPFDRKRHEGLSACFAEMEESLMQAIGTSGGHRGVSREVDLRPEGTETSLTLEYSSYADMIRRFQEQYEKLYGFRSGGDTIEAVNIRLEIKEERDFIGLMGEEESDDNGVPLPLLHQTMYFHDGPVSAPVYRRETLRRSARIEGPAIIIDAQFTVVVDPGFEAVIGKGGIIYLNRVSERTVERMAEPGNPDPVLLEVFNNIFMGIATEMGLTLKNTAHSVNMKERLDFSCALFDAQGNLVANAPHIPVHLGSMADTVKSMIEDRNGSIKPGDVYVTNNPYRGGSHLPDLTVICPVFSDEGRLIFFTAARGHHADMGGSTPGSMPPAAGHIDDEGVLIDAFLLVRDGTFREKELVSLLTGRAYPARNISERISDLKSQIAACHKGMKELQRIIEKYGLRRVHEYMLHIQNNSAYAVKAALHRFISGEGRFSGVFEDYLDDGTPIRASITIDGGPNPPETVKAVIDFTGTGGQHNSDNLNAPSSVTRSAVIYVLRALIDRDIPLNSGCVTPVEIIIPGGTVLSPVYPAPVASGNVETSQRIVDVLLGAMGVAAASQGTMNNLLFEVEGESPYYETIAGGSGAMKDCAGASGVQVHMTNTKITDPEVLEFRHPGVRLAQFTLRNGSGGKGEFPGGDGVVREITFLKPATVSIISERRNRVPYGVKGGEPGERGENLLRTSSGEIRRLTHREVLSLEQNDSVIIKTPGGGGYGKLKTGK